MKMNQIVAAGAMAALTLASSMQAMAADTAAVGSGKIKHVLLISVDGMHVVDFYNCSHGLIGINGGNPFCPNMASLAQTGINYTGTISSKPSDSFPGLAALVTGGTPKSTGAYYDVAYDRSLDPQEITTGTGLEPGPCVAGAPPIGTTTDNDQGNEYDDTKLNGGAPGAGLTEGGVASLDPRKLPRDPKNGCAPVYPWNFVRTNNVFSVVHSLGGYTAWIDKHASYSFTEGPGGKGLDDYWSPEVDSNVVPLPGVTTAEGISCATVRDNVNTPAWNSSFLNIQCYDALKVQGLLNQIKGRTHSGSPAKVPAVFGMNFQSVYFGESLVQSDGTSGGYQNAAAYPTLPLLKEIQFVDASIGVIVDGLKDAGLYDDTLVIISAKHGESPIDPTRYVADGSGTPATILGNAIPLSESPLNPGGIGATEDDVSVLWLKPTVNVQTAVGILEQNASAIGLGEIYYGPTLWPNYNTGGTKPGDDPRTPDIIVTPNEGVTYSGSTSMIGDHGGFAHDDTNVVLLVANPSFTAQTISAPVTTTQVAPTILQSLGVDPSSLDAVKLEGTGVLPGVSSQIQK